jgi:hypothetical protein
VFALVAFAAGDAAIAGASALIRRVSAAGPDERPRTDCLSVAFLVGYGICAVIGVVLALAHLFYWRSLLPAGAAQLAVSRHRLPDLGRAALASLRDRSRRRDPL